jgi:hypothetical protein
MLVMNSPKGIRASVILNLPNKITRHPFFTSFS